jgi:hypothetical protein
MSLDYSKFSGGLGFTKEALTPFADTAHGVSFLEKHLHPPGGAITGIDGVPDRDALSSVPMEYRLAYTEGPPTDGTGNWSCLAVTLPSVKTQAVVFKWRVNDPIFPSRPTLQTNTNFVWEDALIRNTFARTRGVSRSTTVYFNAPALADQGTVYACQQRAAVTYSIPTQAPTSGITYPAAKADIGRLDRDGEFITMMSPKALMTLAKGLAGDGGGVYTSNGFSQPTLPYKESGASALGAITPEGGFQTGWRGLVRWEFPTGGSTGEVDLGPQIAFDDFSFSYILFVGISETASLEFKHYYGLEAVPAPRSPFCPFLTPGAEPDEKAMESAYKIRFHMQDAYPSSRNFLGALGGILSKVAPVALNLLGGLFNNSTPAQSAPVAAPRALPAPPPRPAPRPAPRAAPRAQPQAAPRRRAQAPVAAPRTRFYEPVYEAPRRRRQRRPRRR